MGTLGFVSSLVEGASGATREDVERLARDGISEEEGTGQMELGFIPDGGRSGVVPPCVKDGLAEVISGIDSVDRQLFQEKTGKAPKEEEEVPN